MPYYPQLASGSLAHYPLRKTVVNRTIVNEGLDGTRLRYADAQASAIEWTLEYRGLLGFERNALEEFFLAREGRLESFVFADPTGNLLSRSEEFDGAPWASDPQLQWTASLADPFGGSNAMRVLNVGSIAQAVEQQVDLPGTFHLCFSVYVRSDSPTSLVVSRTAGTESHETTVLPADAWRRISLSGSLTTSTAPVRFRISVPAGASVDLFGAQAEPQPVASSYRKTLATGGVYPEARFTDDELNVVAEGVNSFAARVTIRSSIGG